MNPQDNSFGKYKYANGKIYKLCCKDPNITEIYIGSTLNQYRRKHEHKRDCNNPNRKAYNLYVYQFIRENGGFENWDIVILEEYPAENKNELVWKEREYIELLQPALNCVKRPVVTSEENRKKLRELERKYYKQDTEKFREKNRKWRENNPDKVQELKNNWCEKNKERVNCDICNKDLARCSLWRHKKQIHST